MDWTPLLWLAAALAGLLVVERWIHRHLQGTALLVTEQPQMATVVYALPMLPGIALHELSHALAALLLGVRVGRISIRPKLTGKRVQLGSVPVERTDAVRASLIGLAPLLIGSVVILIIGYAVFGLNTLGTAFASSDWAALREGLSAAVSASDGLVWAYIVFAISNTMLPSRADRQAWTPVLLFIALAALLAVAASLASGLGPVVVAGLAGPTALGTRWLAATCTFTVAMDLPFVLLVAALEAIVGRIKGMRVEY